MTGDGGCVNLDALVPQYLTALPRDDAETDANRTGYAVYKDRGDRMTVVALYLGAEQATGTGSAVDLTTGLVAHWKLDETSGTTAADASGNGHQAALQNGPTPSTNVPPLLAGNPRSLGFDGVNDYAEVGTSVKVDAGDQGYLFSAPPAE
jgi:hypothetical protein